MKNTTSSTLKAVFFSLAFLYTTLLSAQVISIKNQDRFPADDHLTFSRIEIPWKGNTNHNEVTLRVNNTGNQTLHIAGLVLSDSLSWQLYSTTGTRYFSTTPLSVTAAGYRDIVIKFVADSTQGRVSGRVALLHDTLKIHSNATNTPIQVAHLHGLWQKKGEGGNEPWTQEILQAFGYGTDTGYSAKNKNHRFPVGDEIYVSYFVSANPANPVKVRQLAAYHKCCNNPESIYWQLKGSTVQQLILTHQPQDGQILLPELSTASNYGEVSFSPTASFALQIEQDNSDPILNHYESRDAYGNLLRGVRVWKAIDQAGNIIPNTYLVADDHLSTAANYDYNDNVYLIRNVKPESGEVIFREAEKIYQEVADVSGNDIFVSSGGNSSAQSASKSVRLTDAGDKIRLNFSISKAGQYIVRLRVRSGNAANKNAFWTRYRTDLDNQSVVFEPDTNTISKLNAAFGGGYFGTMVSDTINFTAGSHQLTVEALEAMLAVDFLQLVSMGYSTVPAPAAARTTAYPATEPTRISNMVLYPNPVIGSEVYLALPDSIGELQYRLYNQTGKMFSAGHLKPDEAHKVRIPVEQLSKGMYYLSVWGSTTTAQTFKVVKP
jgi:hypothetical protein